MHWFRSCELLSPDKGETEIPVSWHNDNGRSDFIVCVEILHWLRIH